MRFVPARWMGVLLTTLATSTLAPSSPGAEPTAASLLWTSTDPVVVTARQQIADGKFADAEKALKADGGDVAARQEGLEILRRTRRDYSVSPEQMLAKLKRSLPNVTAADVERWRASGELQSRTIDGKPAFFIREPSNLFRFCGEAKSLRPAPDKSDASAADWTLERHLKAVIAEAEKTGATDVLPIKHTVTYKVTVPATAPGMKSGALVRAWLPFPQQYRHQQVGVKLLSATGGDHPPAIAPVGKGDPYVLDGAAQRTAYFEHRLPADQPVKDVVFEEKFEFTSYAYYPKLDDKRVQPLPDDWGHAHLGERPPHIVFTPQLKAAVAEAVGDETNPLAKARRIFHWINQHIAYHAEDEYCNIPSFSAKALACRRGDCGVQSTLFVTMCRCAGIPARWQSGWETKPDDWNMHDWSEIYIAPYGWIPCDASYGVQKSDDPKVRDFYLGHQDSYRMIVNRDWGYQLMPPKTSLRSEPADFQRGEVEINGRNLYYDAWDYDVTFAWDAKR